MKNAKGKELNKGILTEEEAALRKMVNRFRTLVLTETREGNQARKALTDFFKKNPSKRTPKPPCKDCRQSYYMCCCVE